MTNGTTERRHVIPPAVQAARMQRYSVYLVVLSFIIVGANYQSLTMESVLWFAAGITAAFSLLCATTVVALHAIAWNFDRLRDELAGRRTGLAVGATEAESGPALSPDGLGGNQPEVTE